VDFHKLLRYNLKHNYLVGGRGFCAFAFSCIFLVLLADYLSFWGHHMSDILEECAALEVIKRHEAIEAL
jgi:hypothetical protein